jgi:hypothetical protein
MEQTQITGKTASFNQAAAFNSSAPDASNQIDDNWIVEQLFAIRALESSVERALAASNGKQSNAIRRQLDVLESQMANFDAALSSRVMPKAAPRLRARAC